MRNRFVKVVTILFMIAGCSADAAPTTTPLPTDQPAATIIAELPTATSVALGACPSFVNEAFDNTKLICDATARNQVCYSNSMVTPRYNETFAPVSFDTPGDIASIANFAGFDLTSNLETNAWGIVLMRLQASLPDTLPGENITLLLFGDASFEDRATAGYYFSSGIGEVKCKDAPANGILVQTPAGAYEVTMQVNGAEISLGSTAYLEAEPGEEMRVNVVEGRAVVTAQGETQVVVAGMRTRIGLNADGIVNTIPALPEPYSTTDVNALPVSALERPITVAPPLMAAVSGDMGSIAVVDDVGNTLPTLILAKPQGALNWTAGSINGVLTLPIGTYEIEAGAPTPTRGIVTIEKDARATLLIATGRIQVVDATATPIMQSLAAYDTQGRFLTSSSSGELRLPPGNYRIAVFSTPVREEDITIRANETVTINVEETGTIRILDANGALAAIGALVFDAQDRVVTSTNTGSVDVLPGDYRVEISTNPTTIRNVTVESGASVAIQLTSDGTIRVIDTDGNPLEVLFVVRDQQGALISSYSNGTATVKPGTYEVEVLTQPSVKQTVTLKGADTATITIALPGTISIMDAAGSPTQFLFGARLNDALIASSTNGSMTVLPGTYTVEIYTQPQVNTTVTVRGGQTTTINAPITGILRVTDPQGKPVPFLFGLRDAADNLVASSGSSETEVLVGSYSLEIYTQPEIQQAVTIRADAPAIVTISLPGKLQLVDAQGANIEGMVRLSLNDQDTYFTITVTGTQELQPGRYLATLDTVPPRIIPVSITTGKTTTIALPVSGSIQVVDARQQPAAIALAVYLPDGTFVTADYDGRIEVLPGAYNVQINGGINQAIRVAAAQTTTVMERLP